jgi:short-subunit dehydrogenase
MNFSEKYGPWALVVGASEGLGAAFAHGAAARGCNVALVARTESKLEATANALRDVHQVQTRVIKADLATPDAAKLVLDGISDLDVGLFIYNAAVEPQGLFIETSDDELLRNIHVNCTVPTQLTKAFAGRMVARGSGGIGLCSSMGALQGIKVFAAYGAAKSYELILAEGLWDELRDQGVDVMAYVIGMTLTPEFRRRLEVTPEVEQFLISRGAQQPEQCAERFFEIFGSGPRGWASDSLEQHWVADAQKPRSEVVRAMGVASSAAWS